MREGTHKTREPQQTNKKKQAQDAITSPPSPTLHSMSNTTSCNAPPERIVDYGDGAARTTGKRASFECLIKALGLLEEKDNHNCTLMCACGPAAARWDKGTPRQLSWRATYGLTQPRVALRRGSTTTAPSCARLDCDDRAARATATGRGHAVTA